MSLLVIVCVREVIIVVACSYLFLANQSSLTASLKEELNKTKKEEKVAVDRVLMSVCHNIDVVDFDVAISHNDCCDSSLRRAPIG